MHTHTEEMYVKQKQNKTKIYVQIWKIFAPKQREKESRQNDPCKPTPLNCLWMGPEPRANNFICVSHGWVIEIQWPGLSLLMPGGDISRKLESEGECQSSIVICEPSSWFLAARQTPTP